MAASWRSTARRWRRSAAGGRERSRGSSPTTAPPSGARSTRLRNSLAQLGVADDECADYLSAELLALRGWAGIVRQIEERPDRVPARDLTVTLRGYLAVRLLFERAALDAGGATTLLRRSAVGPAPLAAESAPALAGADGARARVAALSCGAALRPRCVDRGAVDRRGTWRSSSPNCSELDGVRQRRILHQAFERTIRHRLYDALMRHTPRAASRAAGVPGGFLPRRAGGIVPPPSGGSRAGLRDVQHGRILQRGDVSPGRDRRSPAAALPCGDPSRPLRGRNRTGRRSPRGTLAPSAAARRRVPRLQRASGKPAAGPRCGADDGVRLAGAGPAGPARGVPVALVPMEPRAARRRSPPCEPACSWIARTQRRPSGRIPGSRCGRWRISCGASSKISGFAIASRLSCSSSDTDRSVSTTLTSRPTTAVRAAADAAGRTPGPSRRWPTTRACASCWPPRGCPSTPTTWFVGAQRNTCNNAVTFFDEDLVPAACQPLFERAGEAIETARRREAHERCRRFDAVPRWYPPLAALAHVQGRAADLAQPRPEYGHATNAFCIIGRRARTRGLFLDRRAFLVSYDPTRGRRWRDPRAHHGGGGARRRRHQPRVLLQLRRSDRVRLRHQAAAQRHVAARRDGWRAERSAHRPSVADGRDPRAHATGDRRGRHSRIASGASCRATRTSNGSCETAGSGSPASMPESGALWELRSTGFVPHTPEHALAVVAGESAAWYQGKRGFLPPVAIVPRPSAAPDGRVAQAGPSA